MRHTHRGTYLLLGLATLLGQRRASAVDCTPLTRQSTCFVADSLWVPAAPTPFVGVPAARSLPIGAWSLGFDATYLSRPVELDAPSPDPAGREVRVVDDVLDAALSGAYSPAERLEISAILPLSLYRTGTGMTGVTAQNGPSVASTALGDLRLGAGYALFARHFGANTDVSVMSRLDLSLPTGGASAFAGARGPVLAPSFGMDLRHGVFFAAANEAVRLVEPVEFGTARLGTTLVSTLGFGVDALNQGRLSIAVEAWLMPSLTSQTSTLADGTRITDATLIPAEWMASVRTRKGPITIVLGGGAAIPLSDQTTVHPDGGNSDEHFAGVTSPRFRGTFVVRYQSRSESF